MNIHEYPPIPIQAYHPYQIELNHPKHSEDEKWIVPRDDVELLKLKSQLPSRRVILNMVEKMSDKKMEVGKSERTQFNSGFSSQQGLTTGEL